MCPDVLKVKIKVKFIFLKDDTLAELAVGLGNIPLEDEAHQEPVTVQLGAVPDWIEGSLGRLLGIIFFVRIPGTPNPSPHLLPPVPVVLASVF